MRKNGIQVVFQNSELKKPNSKIEQPQEFFGPVSDCL
jgi:hypothetical protein